MKMRKFLAVGVISFGCSGLVHAQGRPIDWPSYGADAQRTGWEKSDSRITKENVSEFQLVLKRKLDNKEPGSRAISPPVIIGNLISYRGFKELAILAGSSDKVWSIDADLDRFFWQRQFDSSAKPGNSTCAAIVPAVPALTPPLNFSAGRPRGPRPAAPPAAPSPAASRVGGIGFGSARSVFTIASDGKMHQLNSSDGSDQFPPLNFVPPGAKASTLTIHDGVLYTTTSSACGGAPNAVWALNLNDADPKPVSFASNGGSFGGIAGFAMGADGTIYVQTGAGPSDPGSNKWSESLLVLTPKDLKLKQYFSVPGTGSVTPVVFTWKEKEMVVTAGKQGTLYLLDAQSPGGADHKTPLYQTGPVTSANGGVWGGLSTWEDADGTRWVLAPVWGAISSEMKGFTGNGAAPNGSIVAFKVEEHDGKPVLTPGWVSQNLNAPQPPVITGGIVFALSSGNYSSPDRPAAASHATLYALDAATGKQMYSSGDQVSSPANLVGMTLANGRVYFTANDNTLYAFGIYLER